jgi:hypothetical protein
MGDTPFNSSKVGFPKDNMSSKRQSVDQSGFVRFRAVLRGKSHIRRVGKHPHTEPLWRAVSLSLQLDIQRCIDNKVVPDVRVQVPGFAGPEGLSGGIVGDDCALVVGVISTSSWLPARNSIPAPHTCRCIAGEPAMITAEPEGNWGKL